MKQRSVEGGGVYYITEDNKGLLQELLSMKRVLHQCNVRTESNNTSHDLISILFSSFLVSSSLYIGSIV